MTPIDLLIMLRRELLDAVGGVKNANVAFYLDETASNATVRLGLEVLLRKYISHALPLGVVVVTRICRCSNSEHNSEYVLSASSAIRKFREPENEWADLQLFQGERRMRCPCSNRMGMTTCYLIEELVIEGIQSNRRQRAIAEALFYISQAISAAGKMRTRSSIREYLLLALLGVNDNIIPQGVEEYIATSVEVAHGRHLDISTGVG